MDWYLSQCDGDWEHRYGVKVDTLDNPGWTITIDLAGTSLEGRAFAIIENTENENTWWACRVEQNQWRAACGPNDLATVIRFFRAWASAN
jgi:hypothetical protein